MRRRKGIEIIEAECVLDHVYMLMQIPSKYSVSDIVGHLKRKSSLMIFEKQANLKPQRRQYTAKQREIQRYAEALSGTLGENSTVRKRFAIRE